MGRNEKRAPYTPAYLAFFLLLARTSVSGAEPLSWNYSLDPEDNLGIHFSIDPEERCIRTTFLGWLQEPPTQSAARTIDYVKSTLVVKANHSATILSQSPICLDPLQDQAEVSLALCSAGGACATLATWDYNSDSQTIKEHAALGPAANAKLGVAFVRELNQFFGQRDAYIEAWVNLRRSSIASGLRPAMDLHTHFGGAMTADAILAIAERNEVPIPRRLLTGLGINCEGLGACNEGKDIILSRKALSKTDYATLRSALFINSFEITTFKKLESIYQIRGPLVKHVGSFKDFLRILAQDYQSHGVVYAELSLSDIVHSDFLTAAEAHLPAIEQETGVKLRFKAALWRHCDPTFNRRYLERVLAIHSPYIVGVDFMGEETNSTREFADLISMAARYRAEKRPHFAIQVHAGESKEFAHNVEEAILAGATQIGHGLNGINRQVLDLALEKRVLIEINLNSNLALSNIDSIDEVVGLLRTYIEKGVRISFGTDGHGMYQTSSLSEFEAARSLGLQEEHFRAVKAFEAEYLAEMDEGFKRDTHHLQEAGPSANLPEGIYRDSYWTKGAKALAVRQERLRAELAHKGVRVLTHAELELFAAGKIPIYFALPGPGQWLRLNLQEQQALTQFGHELVAQLDPSKVFLVTAGNTLGGDAIIHHAAAAASITTLGVAPTITELGLADPHTDAYYLHGNSWPERNSAVLDFIARRQGAMVFIAGGEKAKAFFQEAENRRRNPLLHDASFSLFLRRQAPGVLHKLQRRLGDDQLFDDAPTLLSRLEERGHLVWRKDDAHSAALEDAALVRRSWQTGPMQAKPLPAFCKMPAVESFFLHHYDTTSTVGFGIDRDSEEAKQYQQGDDGGQEDLVTFISTSLEKNTPAPDYSTKPLRLDSLAREFSRQQLPELDPRSLYHFFSQLSPAAMLRHLEGRVEGGVNSAQAAARLCIYLERFAIVDSGHAVSTPAQEGDFLLSPLSSLPPYETVYGAGEQKNAQGKYNDFVHFSDLPKVTAGLSSQKSALGRPRLLILLRGLSGVNKLAGKIRNHLASRSVPSYIVGTDAHITQIYDELAKRQEKKPWTEVRREFLERNTQTVTALMEHDAPVIIYADMNKVPLFLGPYADLAREHQYELVIVKTDDLSCIEHVDYMRKHRRDFLDSKSQWDASELLLSGRYVKQFEENNTFDFLDVFVAADR